MCTYYNPLEGVCLRPKASAKLTQKKGRAPPAKYCKRTQPITNQQRLFKEKNKKRKRRCSRGEENEHSTGPFRARDLLGGGWD